MIGHHFGNKLNQFVLLELTSTLNTSADYLIKALHSLRQLISIFIGQQVAIKKVILTPPNEKVELINYSPEEELPLRDLLVFYPNGRRISPLPENPVILIGSKDIALVLQPIVAN